MSLIQTDVAIIGAGPVGLFAVFECGMHKLKCHVIDALPDVGGQCIALYPEKPIYDIPAHPSILAEELIQKLQEQIAPFGATFHLDQKVTHISQEGDDWHIQTSKGLHLKVKAIIIAAGVGAFGPNRPPLSNIEEFENKSVFYHVKQKERFSQKKIVIAGGGDSAVDWALNLAPIAEKIYFVHRRPKFRAAPSSVEALERLSQGGNVEIVVPYQLSKLEGKEGFLEAVHVSTLEGEEKRLEADVLLPFFGLSMNLGPIAEWGLSLEKGHINVDPSTMSTSTPGIFAIGDIATYKNKMKLILTGFAEGAIAAHEIRSIVYPNQVFHFEYSTTQGVPGK